MRVVQLTPGSGDQFYCENCLRDAALVRAVRARGADWVLVPMYLPLSLDTREPLERTEVFFGGINVYLQQKSVLFRKSPRWLDRFFDSAPLLRLAGKQAGLTNARQLGEMTLSMLAGPRGRQAKEVDRLIEFLQSPENRPDVVVLSNLLLAGLAEPMKQRLGCRLVCLLQDEDGFVDGLGDPWARRVWRRMGDIITVFDRLIAVSRFYAEKMQSCLPIPAEKIEIIPTGLDVSAYGPAAPGTATIGFLGRMCEANGLDLAADAFRMLPDADRRLLVCGGKTAADKPYIEKVKSGLPGNAEFLEAFDFNSRLAFLKQLTVLCSPARQAPAYAMNVLEAMACGVPFVAPRQGVYPEWIELSRAGVLYEPNTPETLAETLRSLLADPARRRELGENGRRAVAEHFNITVAADRILRLFEQITQMG